MSDCLAQWCTDYLLQHITGVVRCRRLQYLPRRRLQVVGSAHMHDVVRVVSELDNSFDTRLMLFTNDCNTYARRILQALALPCHGL